MVRVGTDSRNAALILVLRKKVSEGMDNMAVTPDDFPFTLVVCDGNGHATSSAGDELVGMLALLDSVGSRGYSAWLYDMRVPTLVGCWTAACVDCSGVAGCDDALDCMDPVQADALWEVLLSGV